MSINSSNPFGLSLLKGEQLRFNRPLHRDLFVLYMHYVHKNIHPCKAKGIGSQCAVRLSLALVECGFSLENFPHQKRIHQGKKLKECKLKDPHIVGATELYDYLCQMWDTGLKGEGSWVRDQIHGKPGIIYFQDCSQRNIEQKNPDGTPQKNPDGTTKKIKETFEHRSGDHIDLWTGTLYYNQLLGIGAQIGSSPNEDLFAKAKWVGFFWLPL